MNRLTRRLNNGKELCIDVCGEQCVDGYTWCPKCKPFSDVMKKLAEYESLEEQGLLLRLPCKVGDTIYLVDFEEKTFDEATVNSIEIDTRDNRVLINSDYEIGTWSEDSYVFYSKEEAIKAWNTRKPMKRIVNHLQKVSRTAFDLAHKNQSEYSEGIVKGIEMAINIVKEEGGSNEQSRKTKIAEKTE